MQADQAADGLGLGGTAQAAARAAFLTPPTWPVHRAAAAAAAASCCCRLLIMSAALLSICSRSGQRSAPMISAGQHGPASSTQRRLTWLVCRSSSASCCCMPLMMSWAR